MNATEVVKVAMHAGENELVITSRMVKKGEDELIRFFFLTDSTETKVYKVFGEKLADLPGVSIEEAITAGMKENDEK